MLVGQTSFQIHTGVNTIDLVKVENPEYHLYYEGDMSGLFSYYAGVSVNQPIKERLNVQYDFRYTYYYDEDSFGCNIMGCCFADPGAKANYFTNSLSVLYDLFPFLKAGLGAYMGAQENIRYYRYIWKKEYFQFEKPQFGAQIKAQINYKRLGLEFLYQRTFEGNHPVWIYPKSSVRFGMFYSLGKQ